MPKQILLVDDSVTIHRVVEITFAHEDFAVTAVKTADEGLERARQLKPDVVLADAGQVGNQGKTGYDLCASMRQDAELGKTACLILTGNFTPYDEGKGSSSGADGFVVKPFETQAMIDKVKDAIARRTGGEVASPAPSAPVAAAAAAPAPASAANRAGIESLGKPLSTVAAETSARIPTQPSAAQRPAPLPVPPAPVAAAAPPPPAQPRPTPKATLMGIPAVNPSAYGITTPPAPVATKPAPVHVEPIAPIRPVAAAPSTPIRVEPIAPMKPMAPAPSAPIKLDPPKPAAPVAAHPTTLPANVPQMPRPSLVPGVATPKPAALSVGSEVTEVGRPQPGDIGAVVREAAERAAAAVPAAVASKLAAAGPEYEAIAKLSREVIEQVVWEVVPELAEAIIRAELDRLVRERQNI